MRRSNKFNRDKLNYELAATISSNKLKNLQNNKNLKDPLRSEILTGQNISIYDPLILHKSNTPLETGLTSLCRKGPSFVQVLPAPSFNWLQLQINFDSFRNRLRARYLFRDKNNNYTSNAEGPPTKKSLKWSAPKTNCPKVESFPASVEKDLIQNIKDDKTKDNLIRTGRRDNLCNKESDTIMRLQDKGNRFVIVTKTLITLKHNNK